MWSSIKQILANSIIIGWVAPIVTGVLLAIIVKFILERNKSKELLLRIEKANENYTNAIRPFIIQKIPINKALIGDIKKAIVKKYALKETMIYSEEELKSKILLDVADTRFLTEESKCDLIEFAYNNLDSPESTGDRKANIEEDERQKINKYTLAIYSLLVIGSLLILLIAILNNPEGIKYENNPVVIVSLIITMVSLLNIISPTISLEVVNTGLLAVMVGVVETTLGMKIKKRKDQEF